jgi:hypothetical protein
LVQTTIELYNLQDVSEQYRKKIENIVRKPPPDSDQRDVLEANLPCMYCGFSFVESQLDCLNCNLAVDLGMI